MKRSALMLAALLLTLGAAAARAGTSVLFVGNSFTYGQGSAVRFYRADRVSDLNNEGVGGVPALFQSFATQAGFDYDVSLETRGGAGLDFHLEQKAAVIGRRPWDVVVMHGYSTLDADQPRDSRKLVDTSTAMAKFFRERNPDVRVYLTATWSRADQVYPETGAWHGTPIEQMGRDVRAAYDLAAESAQATAVNPVGEAWNRAFDLEVADANPYDGIGAGKLNLWADDHYHASTAGYYLEALVVFGVVTGRDPRSLGENECSGYELGLSRSTVQALQQIAFEQLASEKRVAPQPLVLPKPVNPERCGAR